MTPPLSADSPDSPDSTGLRRLHAFDRARIKFETAGYALDSSTARLVTARAGLTEVAARIKAKVDEARLVNMDHLPVPVVVCSESAYVKVNAAFAALVGRTTAEIEGQPIAAFTTPDTATISIPPTPSRTTGRQGFRSRIHKADGSDVTTSWDYSPMLDGHYYCVIRPL